MASAPSVILWVGVHGQTAAWGTACRMRDEEPVLIAGLIKVYIKLGHHQPYNARDFSNQWNFFGQRPSQVQKVVCLACYSVLVPTYHKLKD